MFVATVNVIHAPQPRDVRDRCAPVESAVNAEAAHVAEYMVVPVIYAKTAKNVLKMIAQEALVSAVMIGMIS